MEAIPETFKARNIERTGRYKCPLCEDQSTGDEVDTGWVLCPMLEGRPICLGCCLDYQNVARLEDFDANLTMIYSMRLQRRQVRELLNCDENA